MNDEYLETLAAEDAENQPSDELNGELMDGEDAPNEAETQQEPTPQVDEEKESLKAQLQREKDRNNGMNADYNVVSKAFKATLEEFGIDYDEVAAKVNLKGSDLKARVENIRTSENPTQTIIAEFDDLYVNKGGKALLDDVYGTDTQPFVAAFGEHGLNDPELREQLASLEPAKRLNFVVKHGKELLEEMGGEKKTVRQLAKEVAALRAQLNAKDSPKTVDEDVQQPKTTKLPLSGFAGRTTNSGGGSGAVLPKGMF